MKYAFIKEHADEFTIVALCKALGVSTSGYHDWRKRPTDGKRARWRASLDAVVKQSFEYHKGRYGAPRLTVELNEAGFACDDKAVAASLRRQNLVARAGQKFKATTNSNHKLEVAPNLLEQDFSTTAVNQKWVQDISYCATDEGWLYLAVVIDLHSRRVIGWAMDRHMKAELVCDALAMALLLRGSPRDVIVHSDRGSQYCSKRYRQMVERYGLKWSMSKRGDCYDNACAETFFHSMKVELTHGERFTTRDMLRAELFRYIETYYNTERRHSSLDYVDPATFEEAIVA